TRSKRDWSSDVCSSDLTVALFMTPPPNAGPMTLDIRIVGTIFLFIIFLMFYLSPRTVFLIEDGKYRGTWVFIFGVFLASIVRNPLGRASCRERLASAGG